MHPSRETGGDPVKTVGVHNWEELGLEESGSGRLKMKGSSSERKDPEVRGTWEGQDCHCSGPLCVLSPLPSPRWRQSELRVVWTPARLLLM